PLVLASRVLPELPVLLAPDESPVGPELPATACGLAVASEAAHPVSPVFVAEVCAVVSPERPEMAVGVTETSIEPPAPPLPSARGAESAVTALEAGPPAAALTPSATPPSPAVELALPPAPP